MQRLVQRLKPERVHPLSDDLSGKNQNQSDSQLHMSGPEERHPKFFAGKRPFPDSKRSLKMNTDQSQHHQQRRRRRNLPEPLRRRLEIRQNQQSRHGDTGTEHINEEFVFQHNRSHCIQRADEHGADPQMSIDRDEVVRMAVPQIEWHHETRQQR